VKPVVSVLKSSWYHYQQSSSIIIIIIIIIIIQIFLYRHKVVTLEAMEEQVRSC